MRLWRSYEVVFPHVSIWRYIAKIRKTLFSHLRISRRDAQRSRDQFTSTKNGVLCLDGEGGGFFFFQSKKKNLKIILDGKQLKLRLQNTKHFVPPSCLKWDLSWRTWRATALTPFHGNTCILQVCFVQSIASFFFFLRWTVTVTHLLIPGYVLFTLWQFSAGFACTPLHVHTVLTAPPVLCLQFLWACFPLRCAVLTDCVCLLRVYAASHHPRPAAWATDDTEERLRHEKKNSWRLIDKQLAAFESGVR